MLLDFTIDVLLVFEFVFRSIEFLVPLLLVFVEGIVYVVDLGSFLLCRCDSFGKVFIDMSGSYEVIDDGGNEMFGSCAVSGGAVRGERVFIIFIFVGAEDFSEFVVGGDTEVGGVGGVGLGFGGGIRCCLGLWGFCLGSILGFFRL